jgi:hypothetical protein
MRRSVFILYHNMRRERISSFHSGYSLLAEVDFLNQNLQARSSSSLMLFIYTCTLLAPEVYCAYTNFPEI